MLLKKNLGASWPLLVRAALLLYWQEVGVGIASPVLGHEH